MLVFSQICCELSTRGVRCDWLTWENVSHLAHHLRKWTLLFPWSTTKPNGVKARKAGFPDTSWSTQNNFKIKLNDIKPKRIPKEYLTIQNGQKSIYNMSKESKIVILKKCHPTLHGCGSTPYVSSIWAFCRKFRSDISGFCPLREIFCVSPPQTLKTKYRDV